MVWLLCPGQGLTVQQFPKFRMGGRSCKFYLAAINLSGKGCVGLLLALGAVGERGLMAAAPLYRRDKIKSF